MAGKNKIIPMKSSMQSLKLAAKNYDKRGSSLSSLSLSPNELNDAIMGMINIDSKFQPCKQICLGNPITRAGQRKQMAKMLAVVLFPLVILTTITAVGFSNSLATYMNTAEVIKRLDFSIDLGEFLMVLQKERDMSSLYLSRIGSDTKFDLLQAYVETDSALDSLKSWPVSSTNQQREFQTRDRYINHINRHRYQLDLANTTATEEINFYSQDIEIFIKWMYDAVSEVDTGVIWKTLVGFQELIIASEYIGRERGYGIYFYAVGSFRDKSHYLRFVESQDTAKTFFESARMYSATAADTYQQSLDTQNITIVEIQRMREEIKINNSSFLNGSVTLAKYWFSNMSVYRNVMKHTQRVVTDKINALLEKNSFTALADIIVSGGIFLGIMLISPVIVFFVYKMTANIQKYSLSIARKTKALNKEKKQSEAILYQMLPKSIAEHLKQNGVVSAEMFSNCTIFQSDMVGFTKLSSNSSPFQVTVMLNSLFSCFDNRIGLYDVYKVETVGDGYLVVSGVPRRNGIRHASEIATMSLDILYHVNRLELPQFPGESYKIRIGCHSGHVVAGVVGSKNPRYCLFGSTVRVAGLMESSGLTNKIQISHATNVHLQEIEGFDVTERTDLNDVVKSALYSHSCQLRTFWLLKKDIQDWVEDSSVLSDSASIISSL